jgi:hypothetical protein
MNGKLTDTAPDAGTNTQEPATGCGELESLLQAPVSLAHGSSGLAHGSSGLAHGSSGLAQAPCGQTAADEPQVIEADVDGRRVKIIAREEIVLECGNASITLRSNGRIIIKGTYVETCSEGTNRIKGGQVRIN